MVFEEALLVIGFQIAAKMKSIAHKILHLQRPLVILYRYVDYIPFLGAPASFAGAPLIL